MRRRRLVKALVVAVAVWPVVTLVLEAAFRVDPWKLMSFGMYSVPPRREPASMLGDLAERCVEWVELDRETARVRRARSRACPPAP
jgi:hypothetical protein